MWYRTWQGMGWVWMGDVWGWRLLVGRIFGRNFSTSYPGTRRLYTLLQRRLGCEASGRSCCRYFIHWERTIGCVSWCGGKNVVAQNQQWLLASHSDGLVDWLICLLFCCRRGHVSGVSWGWFRLSRWCIAGTGNLLDILRFLVCLSGTWLAEESHMVGLFSRWPACYTKWTLGNLLWFPLDN